MLIIPAIDIKEGKCVRLVQGDFAREKVYEQDPLSVAKKWERLGAKLIHVVDLDGAKDGRTVNFAVIKNIAAGVNIPIQVGGGIRNKRTVSELLAAGVSRVILGTVALENERELKAILKEFAAQTAVALDTKNGKLMAKGWFEDSGMDSIDTAVKLEELGVQRFIYTDVVKDGTLTEPNYKEISRLIAKISVPVIASGGVSTLNNIKKLKPIGVEGVIVGKALYEGTVDLKEALHVS